VDEFVEREKMKGELAFRNGGEGLPNKGRRQRCCNVEIGYFTCCFATCCFVNSCESERTATKVMILGGGEESLKRHGMASNPKVNVMGKPPQILKVPTKPFPFT